MTVFNGKEKTAQCVFGGNQHTHTNTHKGPGCVPFNRFPFPVCPGPYPAALTESLLGAPSSPSQPHLGLTTRAAAASLLLLLLLLLPPRSRPQVVMMAAAAPAAGAAADGVPLLQSSPFPLPILRLPTPICTDAVPRLGEGMGPVRQGEGLSNRLIDRSFNRSTHTATCSAACPQHARRETPGTGPPPIGGMPGCFDEEWALWCEFGSLGRRFWSDCDMRQVSKVVETLRPGLPLARLTASRQA